MKAKHQKTRRKSDNQKGKKVTKMHKIIFEKVRKQRKYKNGKLAQKK